MKVRAREVTCRAMRSVAPPADDERRDGFFASGPSFLAGGADFESIDGIYVLAVRELLRKHVVICSSA